LYGQLTSYSTLVVVTDTWLHFSTKTIIFTQVGANPDPSGLGFGINANCSDEALKVNSCVYNLISSNSDDGGTGALKIFANISDTTSVLVPINSQKQYAYVAKPQSSRLSSLDYTAATYAIYSQCMPVASRCLNITDALDKICTTDIRHETDLSKLWGRGYTTDLIFSTDATAFKTTDGPFSNPYYWRTVLYTGPGIYLSESLRTDPDVDGTSTGIAGGAIVIVTCNSTVYDVTYSSVNSSITDWRASLSNSTIIDLFKVGNIVREAYKPYLYQAIALAGFSKTGREIADKFAVAYSRIVLAGTAAAFEPRDAIASQKRGQIQVAMVPKTPLYVLIAASLLLVAFGIVLSVLALIALKGDIGEVQARLSIHALVAAAYEARAGKPVREVEELFEEKHGERGPRLGFVRTMDGGWTLERHGAN
jgi:hypothetical protein